MADKKAKTDLCEKHRPDKFSLLVGQDAAARQLEALGKRKGGFPNVMMFCGPTGSGKTTAARIVADRLGATRANHTLSYMNAGMEGGKDAVREIENRSEYRPLAGGNMVHIIDECHGLTQQAQEALLIPTENPPEWNYYIFCTTVFEKVLKTLRDRCSVVRFAAVKPTDLIVLVNQISKREGFKPGDKLVEAIVEAADGSARVAVKTLERVMAIEDKKLRLDAVNKADLKKQSIDLCRALPSGDFAKCAAILKNLDGDPEKARRHVLAYANSMLLGGSITGAMIVEHFQYNLFDSGLAGLSLAAFKCCRQARQVKGRGK